MKKFVNGKYIEMTAEEIAEIEKMADESEQKPTYEERLEAIEAAILEGVLDNG